MTTPPSTRSVKFSDDERGGWSSDRPRREGAAPRAADVSVRCQVLGPTDRMRYTPGSLVLIVSADHAERDRFARRTLLEDQAAILSLDKVRALLAGRVPEDQVEERAAQLLDAAATKRFAAGDAVVLLADGLSHEERDHWVRLAHRHRRPRHLILIEVGRDKVSDDDKLALNELRRWLDGGDLGEEGFHTALRLSGPTIGELKRIVFRPPPRDE
ncbi:hypothetical protein Q5424_12340 [Conexibacter sp. JD483]|uniref:AAA family ATPase n=1 Tax=unclassified Conexibacter TaxID=2627773 RepID=UPI002727FF41|nr:MULTISPECIES: AAA family ATPase [unclassified Conexibacter]MDO8187467.1 hypothetical protein [Conexibacter sp. CPCC 205706]MDO8198701.1 hypothetical protein [Conexibacter sp. CPCC 205762]MDR9369879.1 hypothetical protein [Conexibacter sp. JD483]